MALNWQQISEHGGNTVAPEEKVEVESLKLTIKYKNHQLSVLKQMCVEHSIPWPFGDE